MLEPLYAELPRVKMSKSMKRFIELDIDSSFVSLNDFQKIIYCISIFIPYVSSRPI